MASSLPVNGYLYVANNPEHRREAMASVMSLRKVDPTAHATLITNRHVGDVSASFDNCVVQEVPPGFASKVACITNRYYVNTLYLDTDTYICEDPSGLFQLAAWFDVCAAQDPAETEIFNTSGLVSPNTGVVLLNPNSTEFLGEWARCYFDKAQLAEVLKGHPAESRETDQPSFLQALMHTDTKFHALPNIWNARYRFNTNFKGRVGIIHGNVTDYETLRKEMNYTRHNRVWEAKRDIRT